MVKYIKGKVFIVFRLHSCVKDIRFLDSNCKLVLLIYIVFISNLKKNTIFFANKITKLFLLQLLLIATIAYQKHFSKFH